MNGSDEGEARAERSRITAELLHRVLVALRHHLHGAEHDHDHEESRSAPEPAPPAHRPAESGNPSHPSFVRDKLPCHDWMWGHTCPERKTRSEAIRSGEAFASVSLKCPEQTLELAEHVVGGASELNSCRGRLDVELLPRRRPRRSSSSVFERSAHARNIEVETERLGELAGACRKSMRTSSPTF